MMRFFSLLITAFFFLTFVNAQHCFTSEVYNELITQHPEVLQKQAELELFTQQYTANRATQRTTGTIYTIPVVFHIVHNYGPENISDEQVLDAMRILNLDYRKMDIDTGDVVPAFKSIAADCEIQ